MLGSQTGMAALETRRCQALNKRDEPCGVSPLRGRNYCAAHDPDLPESMRFTGGAKPGAGRPKTPTAIDILRERFEAQADDILGVLWDALRAERDGEADHNVRIAAFREIADRSYGKPKQATELTGRDGGPVTLGVVDLTSDAELARYGRRDADA